MPSFSTLPEFTRAYQTQGMDSRASPRFQMVPAGISGVANSGRRFVVLRDGSGATVSVADPSVCNFTEILESALPPGERAPRKVGDRFFRLEAGASPGTTTLVATREGTPATLLDIGVKGKLQVLVAFNFLSDTAGHKTNRPEANVAQFMRTVKSVWATQANVDVVNSGIRRPKIERNLGATILVSLASFRPAGSVARAIDGKGAPGVNLNVFFVHSLQEAGGTGDLDAVTSINTQKDGIANPGLCLFEDAAGTDQAFSLAHEIGHHLGLLDRDTPKRDLMHGTTGQRGTNLTKADVNTANP